MGGSLRLFFAKDMLPLLLLVFCFSCGLNARQCTTIRAAARLPCSESTEEAERTLSDGAETEECEGETLFFNKREFLQYDHRYGAEMKVSSLRRLGVDLVQSVGAAFSLDGALYLLHGCTYQRSTVARGNPPRLTSSTSRDVTSLGLPCDVDAAAAINGTLHAFKGCEMFEYNRTGSVFRPSGSLRDLGFPCDLDAAVEWPGNSVIFIKATSVWAWSGGEVRGPRHTDSLNICSWYLCGEADWMAERINASDITACNGDIRLCPLRLDQVTLPGLHNAGAGFSGGFFLGNCWLRNHARSITEQLQLGIRHLDVDPCHSVCGLLGTCHSLACGGSICVMLKQLRGFMEENRQEVITVYFNHEIVEEEKVFKELTRQLKTQLGPVLNSRARRRGRWPRLQPAIRNNRRLVVIYADKIEEPRFHNIFSKNKWILSKRMYRSTWKEFSLNPTCQPIINITREKCEYFQYAGLLEVSVLPKPDAFTCITDTAEACRPYMDNMLKVCEPYRFSVNKSPNVLLVDYPETEPDDTTSVFNAVRRQNRRNILRHRGGTCRVSVDAAFHVPHPSHLVFLSGRRMVKFDLSSGTERGLDLDLLPHVSAAYFNATSGKVIVFTANQTLHLDLHTLQTTDAGDDVTAWPGQQSVDAAVMRDGRRYIFKGCGVEGATAWDLPDFNLPCDVDAALELGQTLYVFKGHKYFALQDGQTASGDIMDLWDVDLLRCDL